MAIRRVPDITLDQENFRLEAMSLDGGKFTPMFRSIRRDPIEPVPQETLIIKVFRVTGYDPDCDGSLMARLEEVDDMGRPTGWEVNAIGLDSSTTWAIDGIADLDGGEAV